MDIEEQSMEFRSLVIRPELRGTSNSLVAADIQEVGEQWSSDGQDGNTERSEEFDGSGFWVHLFVRRFVRMERKINLGCRRDGGDGLVTVGGRARRYHRVANELSFWCELLPCPPGSVMRADEDGRKMVR